MQNRVPASKLTYASLSLAVRLVRRGETTMAKACESRILLWIVLLILVSAAIRPISQDQRNTARVRVRYQPPWRIWFAAGSEYGSGLPAEVDDTERNTLVAEYGAAIVNQINLQRGRVQPNLSLDAAAGAELYHKEHRSAALHSAHQLH
jgi:hypothetical protein